jgi:hypothetical protein
MSEKEIESVRSAGGMGISLLITLLVAGIVLLAGIFSMVLVYVIHVTSIGRIAILVALAIGFAVMLGRRNLRG